MTATTCIFDAYGTLFDVTAAARNCAEDPRWPRLQQCWQELATHWRNKQLQYTWIRAIANDHADFWKVTCHALEWSLERCGLDGDAELKDRLLALYWELEAYPEVPEMLASLKAMSCTTAILSNGSPKMLAGAVDSAGIHDLIDDTLSVESVGVFKPHASVYRLVEERFGVQPSQVMFVSSNGWDAAAASGFGFRSVWVNRASEPVDRLPWEPAHVIQDLSGIPELAAAD